jgi:sugar phosphate isomerase/epimerase
LVSTFPLVGIGHLTMLDVAPPDWVTLAAAAGFDAVGLRAAAAGPTEEPWPISVGSPMLAETRRRLAGTGVQVLDIEIIKLGPETVADRYEGLFATGAELGARFVNVMADDPELNRVRDNFAAVADQARPYGLRPVIEPMAYMRVASLADAVYVADRTGGGVTVDPLHLRRFGATPDELCSLDPALLLYYQLCDAPLSGPSGLPRPDRLPRGQPVEGIGDAQLEARALRLLPGEGELPLEEIVVRMPGDIPVSVEAPNLELRQELGALEFARRARQAVARVLAVAAGAP